MEIRVKNPWGYTCFSCIENTHVEFKTERACINLITNPYYGRMLFIDGILQSSEKDEHIYHQMITYLSVKHFGGYTSQKSYLIAGGSEGAVVRDLLKYNPKKITMVDWDSKLVNYMKEHEKTWSKGAFLDERLIIYNKDIVTFLYEREDKYNPEISYVHEKGEKYDSIILDLLDPNTLDDIEWLKRVICLCLKRVVAGGSIVANVGGNRNTAGLFSTAFREFQPWVQSIDVPSFQGTWYLLCLRN
jgi:spermidine synthase